MFTKAEAEAYFLAEKQMALVLLIVALLAIAAGALLFAALKTPLHKGMGMALVAIALVQGVVGYSVYARSDTQRKDIVYKMDLNPDAIRATEIPRMEKVVKNFTLYRWLEITGLVGAIVLVVLYKNNASQQWLYGLGIGLAIQATLLLVADSVAERRSAVYLQGLQTWVRSLKQ